MGFKENNMMNQNMQKKLQFLTNWSSPIDNINNDLLDNIEKVSSIYDEPFGDSSFLPTYLLSKFASKYVKVVLSGDGGDETFLGYNRYYYAKRLEKFRKYTPNFFRKIISSFLSSMPSGMLDYLSYPFLKYFGITDFPQK